MHFLRSPRESALVTLLVLSAGALVLTFARAQTTPLSITSGPSHTVVSTSSVQVTWQTNQASTSAALYKPQSAGTFVESTVRCGGVAESDTNHCILLSGLVAGPYDYKVVSVLTGTTTTSVESSVYTFTAGNVAPPAPSSPSGPSTGTVGTSISFTAILYDASSAGVPQNLQMKAVFDWGDSTTYGESSLIYPSTSGTGSPPVSHSYTTSGTYYVRAKAVTSSSIESGWSGSWPIIVAGSGGGSLTSPTLSVTLSGTSATLAWTDPTGNAETGFKIFRRYPGNSWFDTPITTQPPNIIGYTDTGLAAGSTYEYKVQVYTSTASQDSNTVSVSVSGGGGTCSGLTLTLNKTSYAPGEMVNYTAACPSGSSTSTVYFSLLKPDSTTQDYGPFSGTGTSAGFAAPTTSGAYTYRICTTTSCTSILASAAFTVASNTTGVPAAPTNLRLDPAPSSNAIYLKWNDNATNEDKFNLEREVAGTGSWTVSYLLTGANITTYTDTAVTAGTYYSYRVQACLSGTGCSEYSYLTSVSTGSSSGSGGTGGTSNPPRVAATYPGYGANGVAASAAAITATFDQAMLGSSFSAASVTLQRMSGTSPTSAEKGSVVAQVSGGVTYNSTAQQVSFVPAAALMPGTVYQLTIVAGASGVLSAGNIQLDGNNDGTAGDSYTTVFKTAAATQASGTRTVYGRVVSTAGTSLSGVNVYASAPQINFGLSAVSGVSGLFTLVLPQGLFSVSAGTASSSQLSLEVAGDSLFVGGATTALALPNTSSPFNITVVQSERTISGTVSDGTALVSGASVWAWRTDGPGGATSTTDGSGAYLLHVSSGIWRIGANLSSIGPLPEVTRTVGTANLTNVNFAPATSTTYLVTGRVYQDANNNNAYDDAEGVVGAIVRLEGTTTTGAVFGNDVATDSSGNYSLRVPSGTYRLAGWAPGFGQLPGGESFTVNANVTKNVRVTASRSITVNIVSGGAALSVDRAYVDFLSSTGAGNHLLIEAASTGTLQLAAGTYTVRAGIEGINSSSITFSSSGVSGNVLTVGGTSAVVTMTVPSRRLLPVTVTDNQGVLVERAWVELVSQTTGARSGGLTDSLGKVTLEAGDGAYQIAAIKPGLLSAPLSLLVNSTTAGTTIIMRRAAVPVSGRITTPSGAAVRAFIRAERIDEVGIIGKQTELDGSYELPLVPGRWRLYGVADGFAETALSEVLEITASAVTGKNITLVTPVTVAAPRVEPVVPASGGIVQHEASGVTITIPAQALGSSNASSQVQVRETNSVIKTSTTAPVAGRGVDVTATDESGKSITELTKAITIELAYDPALVSAADANKLALAYWDEASGSWVSVGGVVDTASHKVRASVDHLTVFTIVLPFIATPASASAPAAPADERAAQLTAIAAEAVSVNTASAEALAGAVGAGRDAALEKSYDATIVARVVVAGTPAATRAKVLNFVTYGTVTSKKLGAGERAGVVNSYRTAFGRLPASESDWQDVLKIANGRFPSTLSAVREGSVLSTFERIYGRAANRAQANDDAAITVMAYGLRSAARNLKNETAALITFRAIFGTTPSTAADWDAVRAIAYSGAKK